jgi:L-alanine-DL-glutamate epimerase-like enolase superfamily enzyme
VSLSARLGALPVEVTGAVVEVSEVMLPCYEGARPSSVLRVHDRDGNSGEGEHVGWSATVHAAFRECIARLDWPVTATVAELAMRPELALGVAEEEARHRRAGLEAALIDLALRQARSSLAALVGAPTVVAMRYTLSFAAMRAPAEYARAILAHNPSARFKVDVDPAWTSPEITALAALDRVDIIDGKGRGDGALWTTIRAAFPDVVLEDAPPGTPGPLALDQSLTSLAEVTRALESGAAVNVKAPRLGGVLVALRALELASAEARLAYLGGMFEVACGRRQARCLAALACAMAPNDLAPLAVDPSLACIEASPLSIVLANVGFGDDQN